MRISPKNIFIVISLLCIILLFFKYAREHGPIENIKTLHSYQEMVEPSKTWDHATLIFFDVDDTLIHGPELFPRGVLMQWIFRIRILLRYPWLAKPARWEEYYSLMWQQAERFLVEEEISGIIQDLQKHGIVVLGITSMESGSYGVIDSMPEWRASMLSALGINFSKRFADTIFKQFPQYRDNFPQLYKGILCANQQPKSEVLAAFLDYYHIKPHRIIYVDDEMHNLKETAAICAKRGIDFQGYHYVRTQKLYDWNMQRALLQLDHLVTHRTWLSDQQADIILSS